AQNAVKAEHKSTTGVSAEVSPATTKVAASHTHNTAVNANKAASVEGQGTAGAEINASKPIRKVKSGVNTTASMTAEKAAEAKTRTHSAAVKTEAKVKTNAAAAHANTNAVIHANTNSAVKTTKVKTAKVKAAAPKAQVKVISGSTVSIKR